MSSVQTLTAPHDVSASNRQDDTIAPPRSAQSWQTSARKSSSRLTMAFKNEVVSDADIDRYKLPFPKGGGRWWTRDAERDYYLWGGLVGNPAFDETQEGRFFLYMNKVVYWVKLLPGEGSKSLKDSPYIIRWDCVAQIEPEITDQNELLLITSILKQALTVYGYEGQDDGWVKKTTVSFSF